MPRHREDIYSYTMRVITNRRPDGEQQYKLTLPKPIGDMAISIKKIVTGEFTIKQLPDFEQRELVFEILFHRNSSESDQEKLLNADWQFLRCPFCEKKAAPLTFPEGAYPISYRRTHSCGAVYYADRSDRRSEIEWNEIPGTGRDWKIVHNYHIQFGMVASGISPDFDVLDDDDRLVHVIFRKSGTQDSTYPTFKQ
ncbi:MAG: hypothetical protein RTU92_09590 [Candidatus Thorarchaeota archaeon]